jgi:hypothetical protein
MRLGRNKLLELITVPRNRRALVASQIVVFMQQVSGNRDLISSRLGYKVARTRMYTCLDISYYTPNNLVADLNLSSVVSTLLQTTLPRFFPR